MGDPLLVKGFGNLISPDALGGEIDINELEKQLYGESTQQNRSYAEKAQAMMAATAANLGLALGGDFNSSFAGTPIATPTGTPRPQYTPRPTPRPETPTPTPIPSATPMPSAIPMPSVISSYEEMTNEEIQRERISSVMGHMGGGPAISFAAEKARDEKLQLLAEIDDLRDQLKASNCRTDGIREVDGNSTLEEVLTVRNILRFKDDRIKYSAMANELIMFLAYGIEELFNGEREFFGYKFDMRGWSSHVQVKLRRIQTELSNITSNIFEETGISPAFRIGLELIPSAVIYSRTRAAQFNQPLLNINEPDDFEQTNARLNDIRNRRTS